MRSHLRLASVLGAASLSVVAVAPAMAAAPVSQSGANAVYLKVAGTDAFSTGKVTATNDGSGEKKNNVDTLPTVVDALDGNPVLNAGVAAQDATAGVSDQEGVSAACAGIAGTGGSVVKIGSGNCLERGQALKLSLGGLDLSGTTLLKPGTALDPLTSQLGPVLEPLQLGLGDLTKAVSDALAQTPLGDIGISGDFGAIEANCTASPGSASGDASLARTTGGEGKTPITLNLPGTPIVLAEIDSSPAPNTKVVTKLDTVTGQIITSLTGSLNKTLDTVPAPLNGVLDTALGQALGTVQDQLVKNLVAQLQPVLQPLEKQVLDITLNKQDTSTPGNIKVSAIDLQLLPAAGAAIGDSLVNLQLGNVACGPSGRVQAAAAAPSPSASASPTALPTAVSAGVATAPASASQPGDSSTNTIVMGAFALLVSLGAGFVSYRRLRA